MVLDFRVLGPAEVTTDGRPVSLGAAGRWLWNDDSRRSKGALQTYVLRLRRAPGDQVAIRTENRTAHVPTPSGSTQAGPARRCS